jgi:hypothetical protein
MGFTSRSLNNMERPENALLRDHFETEAPTQARAIIAERYTVTEETRKRRRNNKGEGPLKSSHGTFEVICQKARTERGDLPRTPLQPSADRSQANR